MFQFFSTFLIIDAHIILIINYGLHFILTAYIAIKGLDYEIDNSEIVTSYRTNKKPFFFIDKITDLRNYIERAKLHLSKLLRYWVYISIVWAFFYLIKCVDETCNNVISNSPFLYRGCFNFFNLLETGFIINCYYILRVNSYPYKKFNLPNVVKIWWFALLIIFAFDIALKWLSYIDSIHDYSMFFDIIGGVLSCTFFSLFFARLDSKFLGFPISLIAILFFYACLQAIFPILHTLMSVIENTVYDSPDFKKNITQIISNFFVFGYYFALLTKVLIYNLLFKDENKKKILFYFVSMSAQSLKIENLRSQFQKKININSKN